MKRARVLLWVIGVLMCVISILLFTNPIDALIAMTSQSPLN
jgi:hypothetical protein